MPGWINHPLLRLNARGLLAVTALMAYLTGMIGFPLPQRMHCPETGSHACAQRGCGCATEEQCRLSCCCCKPSTPAPEPTCEQCCQEDPPVAPVTVVWVDGLRQRECSGLATVWLTTTCCLPPTQEILFQRDDTPTGLVFRETVRGEQLPALPSIPPPRARG
ncbi:MAG: hypothetical protein U0840_16680 [Gemmataceae bacterium]